MRALRRFSLIALSLAGLLGCSEHGNLRSTQVQPVVASEVNLGRPFVGDRVEATFPVTAFGEGVFRVKNISTEHPLLSLDWGQHAGGVSVARGSTLNVKVGWSPTEVGNIDTTITVELDFEGAPLHTVHVTGEARAIPSCDDGNQCTDDAFDRGSETCVHSDHEGSCNDGNACTDDDQCEAGVCRGVAKSCNDDNVCTLDLCDPTSGCVFPPDNRQCEDKDPCTADVCDPDDGCSHPDAADGTACGDFSCSTAHVCVFGSCRELDISGSSDGFPCTDGNTCTDGDSCLAGQCRSGPLRSDTGPTVVASLDTYGGEFSFATTDGYRYLFVDQRTTQYGLYAPVIDNTALLVTTWDGVSLKPHGGLPIVATNAPVNVAPGLFAVPAYDKIVLVNAIDPDHPAIAWENTPTMNGQVTVMELVMMRAGLLATVSVQPAPGAQLRSYVLLMPLANPLTPGQWQVLYASDAIDTVDGDEDVFAVSSADGVWWLRLDGAGVPVEQVQLQDTPVSVRISVQGRMVALLYSYYLELVRADGGAKRYGAVPTDKVRDIAIVGSSLFTTSWNAGIRAYTLHELTNGLPAPANGQAVDSENGVALDRAKDHLLVRGNISLPLRLNGGSETAVPTATRVTGVGHGSVTRAVEGTGTKVLLGSNTTMAEVDVQARAFSQWSLLARSPAIGEAYLLKGDNLSAPASPYVWDPGEALTTCDGPLWSRFDATGNVERFTFCGLLGGTVALTPGRVWGTPVRSRSQPGNPASDKHGLRMWEMKPGQPDPVIDRPDEKFELSTGVRASQDQQYVGWTTYLQASVASSPGVSRIQLLRADATAPFPIGEFTTENDQSYYIYSPEMYAVTSNAAMTGSAGIIRLHPLVPPSDTGLPPVVPNGTLPSVALPDARPFSRILWMADGQAWVGWDRITLNGTQINRLSQMRYDIAKNSLEHLGDVGLPALVTSAYPSGDYTVATTPTGVFIVAPSCR